MNDLRRRVVRALHVMVALVVLLGVAGSAVATRVAPQAQSCCSAARDTGSADPNGTCAPLCPCERCPVGCPGDCCSASRLMTLAGTPYVALAPLLGPTDVVSDEPLPPPAPDPRTLDRPPRADLPVT